MFTAAETEPTYAAGGTSPACQPSPRRAGTSLAALRVFEGAARFAEIAVLLGFGRLVAALDVPVHVGSHDAASAMLVPLLATLIATSTFQALGLYSVTCFDKPLRYVGRIMAGWSLAAAVVVAGVVFLQSVAVLNASSFTLWFVTGLITLAASRSALMLVTRAARRAGHLTRNAIVYGTGRSGQELVARLQRDANSDIRICGIFDDRADDRSITTVGDVPCLGNVDALMQFSRDAHIDMLIMALPLAAESRVSVLLSRIGELPIDVRLAASASTLRFRPSAYSYIGSVPMIDLSDRPISGWNACMKWLFDKTIAGLAIIVLAPVMAAVALAVKLESYGPVIFRQKRYGFNNELIEVYKFRSMYVDRTDVAAANLVTRDDPRVTRVGRVIRKASLDELPQLFNVLLGTLSLVGPRPHAVQAKAADRLYPEVVSGYFARHKVKPGITGWAQINGWRGETDTPEKIRKRVEFDMAYIENWSVWLDLNILIKTPVSLLSTDNAY